MKMSDDEINKAIAEWQDYYIWSDDSCPNAFQLRHGKEVCKNPIRDHPTDCWQFDAPNFTQDLNACHEAEKAIADRFPYYGVELARVLGLLKNDNVFPCILPGDAGQLSHATARQRCEALLRALGKWKE